MTTLSVPSIFNAYATPAPCTIWVATGEPPEMMLRRVSEKWPGVCLPPEAGSAGVARTANNRARGVVPLTHARTTPRAEGGTPPYLSLNRPHHPHLAAPSRGDRAGEC